MAKTLMLDGTYCYTGETCRRHSDAIRETVIARKQIKDTTKEERLFIAKRQFYTERNPHSFEDTKTADHETWWKCPVAYDHVWQNAKNARTSRGDGCPFCSGHRASSTNNLEDFGPHLASELMVERSGVTARELTIGSNRKCWWKCSNCGHEYPATPNTRQTSNCGKCRERTGGFVLTFTNSIAGRYPQLVKDFDVEANGHTADMHSAGTTKTCAWRCHICGHKWNASPALRGKRGSRCPACINQVATSETSLLALYPDIATELVEELSPFKASEVVPGSGKSGTWRCSINSDHETWSAPVRNRTGQNSTQTQFGCPACTQAHTSRVEQKFRTAFTPFLKKLIPSNIRLSIPWRKNKSMTVDIAGEYKNLKIAIEYDGAYYHHAPTDFQRDSDKTQALLKAGYKVVRIREGVLSNLSLKDSGLLQVHFSHTNDPKMINEQTEKIIFWLDLLSYSA